MSEFKVGDRVVDKVESDLEYHQDKYVIRGTILSFKENDPNTVKVNWDQYWVSPNPSNISIDKLILEEEADQLLSKLEAEYEIWAAPIRVKMKEAGQLILEANALALKEKKSLVDLHELSAGLTNAMDEVGWSTSSLSC